MLSLAILLLVYLEIGFDQRSYIYVFIIYGLFFLANELISFVVSKASYFLDIWNYIDVTRILILFVYSIIKLKKLDNDLAILEGRDYSDSNIYSRDTELILFAILNFLVWLRVISYLRQFSQTRALIRLLVETIKDMGAFALVLILGVITFIVCYHILTFEKFDNSYDRLSKIASDSQHIYQLAYGELNVDDYNGA